MSKYREFDGERNERHFRGNQFWKDRSTKNEHTNNRNYNVFRRPQKNISEDSGLISGRDNTMERDLKEEKWNSTTDVKSMDKRFEDEQETHSIAERNRIEFYAPGKKSPDCFKGKESEGFKDTTRFSHVGEESCYRNEKNWNFDSYWKNERIARKNNSDSLKTQDLSRSRELKLCKEDKYFKYSENEDSNESSSESIEKSRSRKHVRALVEISYDRARYRNTSNARNPKRRESYVPQKPSYDEDAMFDNGLISGNYNKYDTKVNISREHCLTDSAEKSRSREFQRSRKDLRASRNSSCDGQSSLNTSNALNLKPREYYVSQEPSYDEDVLLDNGISSGENYNKYDTKLNISRERCLADSADKPRSREFQRFQKHVRASRNSSCDRQRSLNTSMVQNLKCRESYVPQKPSFDEDAMLDNGILSGESCSKYDAKVNISRERCLADLPEKSRSGEIQRSQKDVRTSRNSPYDRHSSLNTSNAQNPKPREYCVSPERCTDKDMRFGIGISTGESLNKHDKIKVNIGRGRWIDSTGKSKLRGFQKSRNDEKASKNNSYLKCFPQNTLNADIIRPREFYNSPEPLNNEDVMFDTGISTDKSCTKYDRIKANISRDNATDSTEKPRSREFQRSQKDEKAPRNSSYETERSQNSSNADNTKPREFYVPPEPSNNEDEMFGSGISTGINFDKYDRIRVTISGENKVKPILCFERSGLIDVVIKNLKKSRYMKPTPVQKYSFPIIMQGRDLMACAQTGSGKTAAFLVPIINSLLVEQVKLIVNRDFIEPQVIILSPTRELTIQIFMEARKFAYGSELKVCLTYGGTVTYRQIQNLMRGCNLLVATPGRINYFISRGIISFASVRFIVLDEADRMLDMGFQSDIEKVFSHPTMTHVSQRQTLMFSATFPVEIQKLAEGFLRNYLFLAVGIVGAACSDVEQKIFEVSKFEKKEKLMEILKEIEYEKQLTLIFVEHKRTADFIAAYLSENNIPTTSIHGDRLQSQREQALCDFKNGLMPNLVATAVAARGLDINNVSHVINFDLPSTIDEYVHRIGRTGRVGNRGKATSFYDEANDFTIAEDLARILKQCYQDVPKFLSKNVLLCDKSNIETKQTVSGRDFRRFGKSNDNSGNHYLQAVQEEEENWSNP